MKIILILSIILSLFSCQWLCAKGSSAGALSTTDKQKFTPTKVNSNYINHKGSRRKARRQVDGLGTLMFVMGLTFFIGVFGHPGFMIISAIIFFVWLQVFLNERKKTARFLPISWKWSHQSSGKPVLALAYAS